VSGNQTAWRLEPGNEWQARDPYGTVKPADVSAGTFDIGGPDGVTLRAARNGYASFRLEVTGRGEYRLSAEMAGGIEPDLYRAWYHKMAPDAAAKASAQYCTDALVPVRAGQAHRLPDPGNAVADQTHQAFWVDLFVPADAAPGAAAGRIVLDAGRRRVELPVTVEVAPTVIPDADAIVADHNSYGCRWIEGMYPSAFAGLTDPAARWEKIIEVLHHYYRLCHEHRGMLSNLGAGHAGTVDPIYAPTLRGRGRDLAIADWGLFDRHYGPLLDGTAFAAAAPGAPRPRRPATPVWGVYTPISNDWPADYLWWGQPGYEVEFTRGVAQFDRHFRDRGWTAARPYLFFNHKKRYRWYEWDGDEPKYGKDDTYFRQMHRLFAAAVGDSPVPWAYRMDASWRMADHFERLAGMVDFWVCGGFARWYPDEIARTVARGDTVWTYSGTPGIAEASSAGLENVLKPWARGVAGHCEWLTTDPGPDPWFACAGAETGAIYPGERFGIAGPIPSIRLKLQRNAVQDVNLIAAAWSSGGLEKARAALAGRVGVPLWDDPPPVVRDRPPEEWDSRNLDQSFNANMTEHAALDPLWWAPIRQTALGAEGKP